MHASRSTIRRIIKEDLGLSPFNRRKVHVLTKQKRRDGLKRSKALLERYENGDVNRIVFYDEKLFTIKEHVPSPTPAIPFKFHLRKFLLKSIKRMQFSKNVFKFFY